MCYTYSLELSIWGIILVIIILVIIAFICFACFYPKISEAHYKNKAKKELLEKYSEILKNGFQNNSKNNNMEEKTCIDVLNRLETFIED